MKQLVEDMIVLQSIIASESLKKIYIVLTMQIITPLNFHVYSSLSILIMHFCQLPITLMYMYLP